MTINSIVLVDAHVHVHSSASIGTLLASAVSNFGEKAAQLGKQRWQGVLLLAETRGVSWFETMLPDNISHNHDGWLVTAYPREPSSLLLRHSGAELLVVAGRQIVSAEGIEVLALGTRQQIPEGQPLPVTLEQAQRSGAVVVLPWGVGKWLGRRGQLVARALSEATDNRVLAGDNGGRPLFWPSPTVFQLAASRGHPVLPGTDPLPLPGEERQVGRVGFWMLGELSPETPFAALRTALLTVPVIDVHPYGPRESVLRFFRNQLALRVNKYLRHAS